jgi:hypothetical protein
MSNEVHTGDARLESGPRSVSARKQQRDREQDRIFAVVAGAILKAPVSLDQKGTLLNLVWAALLKDRKRQTLEKELREAERAFGEAPGEQNFQWLQDVKRELAVLEGADPDCAERKAAAISDAAAESPNLTPAV